MADDLFFSLAQIKPKNCILSSLLSFLVFLLSQFPQLFFSQGIGFGLLYLLSHFSVSQPKTLRSRARGYLSELRRATCPEKSHSSFCSPFFPAEFLAAASNLSSFTATGPDKVAYPMLKHLPRSGMDFLLHIFNLSWTLHSFSSIWKTSSIIPIHKMGKPPDSPASFRLISLTSCVRQSGRKSNPAKTQFCLFHLRNHHATRKMNVIWNGTPISHDKYPVYLGVTMDRTLFFKEHTRKLKAKIQ